MLNKIIYILSILFLFLSIYEPVNNVFPMSSTVFLTVSIGLILYAQKGK